MSSKKVWIVGGAAVVLVVLVGLVASLLTSSGGSSAVTLEPVATDGPDPFTSSVVATAVPAPSELVARSSAELVALQPVDESTGARSVPGATAGLYGGTRDDAVCDPAALVGFLSEDESKASAWAEVVGVDPTEIASTVASWAPVVLTADTLVTNHGYSGGRATPRQSVLQAGTAVLVDDEGLPRVRCSCGNPLTAAAGSSLTDAPTTGPAWPGYATEAVAVVRPSEPVASLTVVDLTSGQPYEQPVGGGDTWIAVSGTYRADGGTQGAIHVSSDGRSWATVQSDENLWFGVATSPDLAVAVGASPSGGGVVQTSSDGTSWSPAVEVVDPLRSVAHGDGRWVAVGDRSFAEDGGAGDASNGAIWTSTDGATWERVAETSPYDNTELTARSSGFLQQAMISVAYGDGQWVASAQECAEQVCLAVEFTSTDGVSWSRRVMQGALGAFAVGHDGTGWGFVGREATDPATGDDSSSVPLAGRSATGTEWEYGPTTPDDVFLEGLGVGPGGWLAVQDRSTEAGAATRDGIYRSADLATWSELSAIDADLRGIAVLAARPVEVAAPTTTTSTTVAPSADVAGIRILTRGLQFQDAAGLDLDLVPYDGPATPALDSIGGVLGPPESRRQAGDGTCVAESTVYSWGALMIVVPGSDPGAAGWQVVLSGEASSLPSMPVTVPGEFTLGASAADVAGYFPGVPTSSTDYQGTTYRSFLVDPSGGELDPGTLVAAEGRVVRTIAAPEYLEDFC